MEFRDVLRDLVTTTSPVGFDTIVISKEDRGNGEKIHMESFTSDKQIVMRAYVKEDVKEITDTFGLGNLGMLQGLLGLNTYQDASTKIFPSGKDGTIERLTFTSDEASTEFLVSTKKYLPKQPKFTNNGYDVQVTPSAAKVSELKSFSGVFKTISPNVTPYTENGNLSFKVGNINKNVHNGSLQFTKCEGELKVGFSYPVERILQALSRVNNALSTTIGISTRGVLNVTVDTGVAVYEFYLMGN